MVEQYGHPDSHDQRYSQMMTDDDLFGILSEKIFPKLFGKAPDTPGDNFYETDDREANGRVKINNFKQPARRLQGKGEDSYSDGFDQQSDENSLSSAQDEIEED